MIVTPARLAIAATLITLAACGPTPQRPPEDTPSTVDTTASPEVIDCPRRCSDDLHSVLDCNDNVLDVCDATEACDMSQNLCNNACQAAEANHRSIGCDYYAVHMHSTQPTYCYAAIVANTWTAPAKIQVSHRGTTLPVEAFTRIPSGTGQSITYAPYSAATGIPPGQVAILFLGGGTGQITCPTPAAVTNSQLNGTGVADAFHITSDVPVVAYQINPYGGGSVAVTAASLLLPASVWDTSYIAMNISPQAAGAPSMNIVAKEDGTIATIIPRAAVVGGGGIPSGAANLPLDIMLNKGQYAQITQSAELTGSVITSNKPIGFMAGQVCMNMPVGVSFCDHGEQMVPPIPALGHQYVGVMYRPRVAGETTTFWRIVGAANDTVLTWTPDVGGPATLQKGQVVVFQTGTPFVVTSQDKDHAFQLGNYMTGSNFPSGGNGFGDPDYVISVPPAQYLKQYVFFTDPTYPETNLVVVRARGTDAQFHDVELDCAGNLGGWQAVGPDHQFTRVDLSTGNFQPVGGCSTGRHEIKSTAPFGLWIWGWGTPQTSTFTANVSYGYPGGMNVARINDIIIN